MTNRRDHDVPLRTCIGCRTRRPQPELVRCVAGPDGSLHVGRGAPGRGAWLCGVECFDLARRRRGAFERAWRIASPPPGALDELRDALGRNPGAKR